MSVRSSGRDEGTPRGRSTDNQSRVRHFRQFTDKSAAAADRDRTTAKAKEKPRETSAKKGKAQSAAPRRRKVPSGPSPREMIRELPEGQAKDAAVTKRRRERENESRMRMLVGVLGILIVLLIAALIYEVLLGHGTKMTGAERMAEEARRKQEIAAGSLDKDADGDAQDESGSPSGNDTQSGEGSPSGNDAQGGEDSPGGNDAQGGEDSPGGNDAQGGDGAQDGEASALTPEELKAQADRMAMQYDYDRAIALLKSAEDYEENQELQTAVAGYAEKKNACVPYPADKVTHIFFHTLIHDPKKAFDGDEYEGGFNQFMVTEHEFNSIIEQMYQKGYVMVFLSDIVSETDDGNGGKTFAAQDIMLPPDKIPFVLSQDDVSYYHYMDGHGFASRLIVDQNGDVKNEYIEDDGSISVGDYDMVPLIDRFVEKHPDFSYRGAKGYVALTGYEGILGYRTDEVYKTKEEGRVTVQQQMFFDSYPGGFDEAAWEKECREAEKVANAMKGNGWKFASHTWGHQNMHETNGVPWALFVQDTDRWESWVEPLIGETDTMIYAFGGDICEWENYSGDRFQYLKQAGFNFYCGVDSAQYWLQVGTDYVRQSRRNVDGYRMYYNPDMLSDLFDVSRAWDPLRPSSVPPI